MLKPVPPVFRPAALTLIIPAVLAQVRILIADMRAFLAEHGLSDDDVRACELALVEACNNAIKYTLPATREEPIRVDILVDDRHVEMRVNDRTAGFDWPEQIELPDPDQETGRGLFLITSLMDRTDYYRGHGSNCLVMQKLRGPRETQAAALSAVAGVEETDRQLTESEQVIRDMAEELSFCYESLSAIFRCSAELGRTNNLEDFARRLLADLAQITSADWFLLRLISPQTSELTVFTASESSLQLSPLQVLPECDGKSVEADAAASRDDIWFDHANPVKPSDPIFALKPGSSGLVHPFFFGDALVGTLTVAKAADRGSFTAVQANVVHTFADFLAIQIVNAQFSEEQVRTRLVSRELEIAKTIQRSLLPKTIPRLPGYGLAGFCESAHQVGGDFYDVLKVNDDSVLLIIADVMGKGIPAAMFAAILRSLLRAVPEWTNQPATLLSRVNRLLFEELSGVDMFITAQLVFVNSKERTITTASAGHCPLLLAVDSDNHVKALSPEGLPLGILPDTTFSNETESLPSNARVLLYTDGLTEARNPKGEFFGQDRLMKWLKKSAHLRRNAEDLKNDLAAELLDFQSSTTLSDDQTFLIMAE